MAGHIDRSTKGNSRLALGFLWVVGWLPAALPAVAQAEAIRLQNRDARVIDGREALGRAPAWR